MWIGQTGVPRQASMNLEPKLPATPLKRPTSAREIRSTRRLSSPSGKEESKAPTSAARPSRSLQREKKERRVSRSRSRGRRIVRRRKKDDSSVSRSSGPSSPQLLSPTSTVRTEDLQVTPQKPRGTPFNILDDAVLRFHMKQDVEPTPASGTTSEEAKAENTPTEPSTKQDQQTSAVASVGGNDSPDPGDASDDDDLPLPDVEVDEERMREESHEAGLQVETHESDEDREWMPVTPFSANLPTPDEEEENQHFVFPNASDFGSKNAGGGATEPLEDELIDEDIEPPLDKSLPLGAQLASVSYVAPDGSNCRAEFQTMMELYMSSTKPLVWHPNSPVVSPTGAWAVQHRISGPEKAVNIRHTLKRDGLLGLQLCRLYFDSCLWTDKHGFAVSGKLEQDLRDSSLIAIAAVLEAAADKETALAVADKNADNTRESSYTSDKRFCFPSKGPLPIDSSELHAEDQVGSVCTGGALPGDVVLAVNGVSTVGLSVPEVREL